MSVETLMTLGLAAAIFATALVLLGLLTLVTRVTMFVLRPAARGSYSLARRYAPVARRRLVTFWERTSPALAAVGEVLAAEALASTKKAAAVAASWSRRLSALAGVGATHLSDHAAMGARRAGVRAGSVRRRSAAGARSLGKRSAAGAASLSERSADGVTTYVVPAVRSLFSDDEDLGLEPTFSPRRPIKHP